MSDEKTEQLIRDNERMRTALELIKGECRNAVFGAWRQKIYDMARGGLHELGYR